MVARLGYSYAVALVGLEGYLVRVEAHLSNGLPSFSLVGLPDVSIREAKQRVEAAIASAPIRWEPGHLTVNLAPADIPKNGSGFDLAIAVAILSTRYSALLELAKTRILAAEIGLDGSLLPIRGILAQVIFAKKQGFEEVVVSEANYQEAKSVPGVTVYAYHHLGELLAQWLPEEKITENVLTLPGIPNSKQQKAEYKTEYQYQDLAQVQGLEQAKEGLELAAIGGHNLLFRGSPGTGKTMLANCLPGILPKLSLADALQVSAIHSLAGVLTDNQKIITRPPFIAPHHSASLPALIGGGSRFVRPGAISLAHCGVLFLDEAPEFSQRVLESLRQPLETREISIHRAYSTVQYPAAFQLILAANPCPCGASMENQDCQCSSTQKKRYYNRLSLPLLERIDIHIPFSKAKQRSALLVESESSAVVAERVKQARALSRARWEPFGYRLNADVPGALLREIIPIKVVREVEKLLRKSAISMRSVDRLLKLSFSVADRYGRDLPNLDDLFLALSFRDINIGG